MQTKWTDCCVFIPEAEVAGGTDAQIQGMGTQATSQAFGSPAKVPRLMEELLSDKPITAPGLFPGVQRMAQSVAGT